MRGLNQEHDESLHYPRTVRHHTVERGCTHSWGGCYPRHCPGPSLNKVEKGVPVVIDYGGGYNGYITDETRTFVVGELKERFKNHTKSPKRLWKMPRYMAKRASTEQSFS